MKQGKIFRKYIFKVLFVLSIMFLGYYLSFYNQASKTANNSPLTKTVVENNQEITDQEKEPDNTVDEAYPLKPGVLTKADFSSNGDVDIYKFYAVKPVNLTISLFDLPEQYLLEIYDSKNNLVGKSVRQGFKTTTSELEIKNPGKYYIQITPQYSENKVVPYSIKISSRSLGR